MQRGAEGVQAEGNVQAQHLQALQGQLQEQAAANKQLLDQSLQRQTLLRTKDEELTSLQVRDLSPAPVQNA